MLNVQDKSVEKGLSASSYFDQFGGESNLVGVDDNVNTSVFEAFGQSDSTVASSNMQAVDQPIIASANDETLEWYKAQLEQYQQAINDWQAWSQSQLDEVSKLKVEFFIHFFANKTFYFDFNFDICKLFTCLLRVVPFY